jgi:archaellum biogenesis protein FlaJ (TadC family)
MTKLSLNKVETFIKGLDQNPQLKQQFDADPKDTLIKNTAINPKNDVWIYRIVVASLSLVVLIITTGILINVTEVQAADKVITIIASLGSAAIGALAGLLAPSPGAQEDS